MTKIDIVNPSSKAWPHQFTRELAAKSDIAALKTNRAGQYGFRIVCLSDRTGDKRLIDSAIRFADDHAMGVEGIRAEKPYEGGGVYCATRDGWTQTRLDALERHRKAVQAIGQVYTAILFDVAINGLTAREMGRRWRCDHKTASRKAILALNALANWYER